MFNSINGKGSWANNSWVWVIEFKQISDAIQQGKKEGAV